MQIPPLDVLLAWPSPNYENSKTRGEALLVLLIIFSILVVAAVIARFYSRIVVKKWYGLDDTMIALALLFTLGMNTSVILANRRYGWNRHIWDIQPGDIQNANIVAFSAKLLFVQAATFTRISLICFYYRLVRDSGIDWFIWVLHGGMFFVIGLGIAFTCIGIWLCSPVQAYWVFPPIAGSKCMDEGTTTLTIGIFNCLADLTTTLLPIPLVMRLKMPLKQRIEVCFLLGLGFVVTIAGIVRTYFIWKSLIDSWDTTWYSYPLWIAAAIEIDVAVICACAPALKPLIHQPIARMTSIISMTFGSLRSPDSSRHDPNSSSVLSARSNKSSPFRFRQQNDSVWDGDSGYGMLRVDRDCEKDPMQAVHLAGSENDLRTKNEGVFGGMWGARKPSAATAGTRLPPLEIIKRQSVDQEISYVNPEQSRMKVGSPLARGDDWGDRSG
ncbi:unnamed protein product [Zymoseptoria tritici ST99CH_1A5]|uniref:Rhodopsin domain-containing protein n=1 Tax=Zymoseptoria tritici ST99CH_1A5 TaxID=1276529 RepID=A0A1Y6LIZ9_ZYMTR|nr:unnamed protein product [Zymoseptoria tritici ST99CH_1A5]